MPDRPDGFLILDTHIWLWTVEGATSNLSDTAIVEIEAASRRGEILVSAISVWEIAMLEAKGRIGLAQPLEEWSREALRAPGIRLLDLTPEIAIQSTRLPGPVHGDPADRILMASTRAMSGRLATCDHGIVSYAEEGHLRVLDARR